jgi:ankyrin repeat protein
LLHQNKEGKTPLMLACERKEPEIVKMLLNAQTVDLKSWQAISAASQDYSHEIKEIFSKHKHALEEIKPLITIYSDIQKSGDNTEQNGAKQQSENPKASNPKMKDLLFLACNMGMANWVQILLEHTNAHVLQREDKTFNTPLHLACRNGHNEVVEILIQYPELQKRSNQRNNKGLSPLLLAYENSRADVVTTMLQQPHGETELIQDLGWLLDNKQEQLKELHNKQEQLKKLLTSTPNLVQKMAELAEKDESFCSALLENSEIAQLCLENPQRRPGQ